MCAAPAASEPALIAATLTSPALASWGTRVQRVTHPVEIICRIDKWPFGFFHPEQHSVCHSQQVFALVLTHITQLCLSKLQCLLTQGMEAINFILNSLCAPIRQLPVILVTTSDHGEMRMRRQVALYVFIDKLIPGLRR